MLTHRLLGGSSSLSVSCPSLGSTLIAVAYAHLWSSFRRRSESPLLAHHETKRQEKVSCHCGSCRLFPGQLCCAIPFRLCSHSQPQSSSCDLTKVRASAPSPRPPRRVSRQASRAGECCQASVRESLRFALRTPVAALSSVAPKLPPSATRSLCPRRGFLVCGNLSSFAAPSHWCRSRPYSFVSVISFFFCPTQVRGEFLAFGEV